MVDPNIITNINATIRRYEELARTIAAGPREQYEHPDDQAFVDLAYRNQITLVEGFCSTLRELRRSLNEGASNAT